MSWWGALGFNERLYYDRTGQSDGYLGSWGNLPAIYPDFRKLNGKNNRKRDKPTWRRLAILKPRNTTVA